MTKDLYLYELPPELLQALELLLFDLETLEVREESVPAPEPVSQAPVHHDKDYYHSDFYKFNLRRKVQGLPEVSEAEFDEMVEKQLIESILGSEDESEDEADRMAQMGLDDIEEEGTVSHLNTKSPFVLFKGPDVDADSAYGVYKSNFSQAEIGAPLDALAKMSKPPVCKGKSALFMIGGGHFAGAIINHARKLTKGYAPNSKESKHEQAVDVVVSKTFHRYTVRKKQGGSQSASDNARGKANSAGSLIRRYNEQALIKEVRELMVEWRHHLRECHAIYIRANGTSNRKILVGYEGAELATNDPRIRGFPFTTRRATKAELKRAWAGLTYLQVVKMPRTIKTKPKPVAASRSPTPKPTATVSENDKHLTEMVALLKRQKAPKLVAYLKQNKLSAADFRLTPEKEYAHYPTLLHFAAANNLAHMVQVLLVNLGASPEVVNQFDKVPSQLAGEMATRNAFRVARLTLGEQAFNWDKAKVGLPRTKEEVAAEEQAEQKKQKEAAHAAMQQRLAEKTEMEMRKPTVQLSGTLGGSVATALLANNLNGLSDEQRRRLMREQRARAAEARLKRG